MSPSFSHSSFHMFVLFKINDRSSGVESCVKEKAKYSTLTCGLKCWFSWFGSLSNIMMDSRNILISFTLFCYSKVVSFKIYRLFCENCCCKFTTHYIMIENQRPHISWWCCYIYIIQCTYLTCWRCMKTEGQLLQLWTFPSWQSQTVSQDFDYTLLAAVLLLSHIYICSVFF